MAVLASAGDVALIVLAGFWGLLVLFLCIVLINVFRMLESTKMLIDGIREETVPLLGEVKTSVVKANREIDRVDGILENVQRVSGLVQQAMSSPLMKVIAFGAGVSKAAGRFRGGKSKGGGKT